MAPGYWLVIFKRFSTEEAWGWRGRATNHANAKENAKNDYDEALEGLTESDPEGSEDNGDYSCVAALEDMTAKANK
jgi:hypothetical protein